MKADFHKMRILFTYTALHCVLGLVDSHFSVSFLLVILLYESDVVLATQNIFW